MQSSLMRKFKQAAAATGLVLLTVAAPFNASAHVMEGSVLFKHKGFVNAMHRADGTSCCHEEDGLGPLKERAVDDPLTGKPKYQVFIEHDQNGTPLEEPFWEDVPDKAVLNYDDTVAFCADLKVREPQNPDNETCTPPKTNALWASMIPHNAKKGGITIWCYLPLRNDQ